MHRTQTWIVLLVLATTQCVLGQPGSGTPSPGTPTEDGIVTEDIFDWGTEDGGTGTLVTGTISADDEEEGTTPPIDAIPVPEPTMITPIPTAIPVTPVPEPTRVIRRPLPVAFPVDFSTVESSLRTVIFQGDVEEAAEVLASDRVASLAAGLTYEERLSPLVEPSANRNSDPDVVAFKALAQSALDSGDSSKLALVVVLSFQPPCTCGVYNAGQLDDLRQAFVADFSDRNELQQILNADANRSLARKLLLAGKSPVHSFVCSSCWPRKQCNKLHWC